jgi:hypothetical protein
MSATRECACRCQSIVETFFATVRNELSTEELSLSQDLFGALEGLYAIMSA